jgi:myo-inositol-1(or 4)-monophosphatase
MHDRLMQRCAAEASRAALAAGALLAKHAGRARRVRTKRSAIDLVTEIDGAAERIIRRILLRACPTFGVLGEEEGARRARAPYRWIVDPLDGTNNFVHGLPIFGVSIGLEALDGAEPTSACGTNMLVGVIYDPIRRELFTALRGRGATMNGTRLRVSATPTLALSLLSTGFSAHFRKNSGPYLRWFEAFQRRSHGVRRLGSTVFSLASEAAGRLEGFFEQDLWPWDMAAGLLLVEEAGGRVSDFTGEAPALARGQLIASNGRIHRELLRALKR